MDRRLFLQSAVATGIAASFSSQRALAAQFSALTKISADVPAVTGVGSEITLESAALQELAASLRGNLLLPGNDGYDKARHVLIPGIDK